MYLVVHSTKPIPQSRTEVEKLWRLVDQERVEVQRLTDLLVSRNLQELNALRTKPEPDGPDFPYKTDDDMYDAWEKSLRDRGLSEDEIELARVSE